MPPKIKLEEGQGSGGSSTTRYSSHASVDSHADILPPVDIPRRPSALEYNSENPLLELHAQFSRNDQLRDQNILRGRAQIDNPDPYIDTRRADRDAPQGVRRGESSLNPSRAGGARVNGSGDNEVTFRSSHRVRLTPPPPVFSSSSRSRPRVRSPSAHGGPSGESSRASASSSGGSWRPPYDYDFVTPNLPGAGCRCPIHLDCADKAIWKIDCRTLVPVWQRWARGQGGENLWAQLPDDEIENFATPEQINEICALLDRVANDAPNSLAIQQTFTEIRIWLYMMRINAVREDEVRQGGAILRMTDFLSHANAPQRRSKRVPDDIEGDLTVLLRKWQRGDFGVKPHRAFVRGANGRTWALNRDWPHLEDARFFGEGHLINGQIFVNRLALLAEGGHAATQAGIAGTVADGAYSIVMGLHLPKEKKFYADVDQGNTIYYISTALPPVRGELPTNFLDPGDAAQYVDPDSATKGARALMKSQETGRPVRLFRSHLLAPIVPNRPPKPCYRYDGLYQVVDAECLKQCRQIYRFKMERIPGQRPIRGMGASESRPAKSKNKKRREHDGSDSDSSRPAKRSRK